MPDPTLQRRHVLRLTGVAIAGAALAACTTSGDSTHPSTATPGGPEDPDRALRDAVADDELRLAASYAAVTGLPSALLTRVTELGSRHAVYAAAVRPGSTGPSTSGASGSGAATPSAPAASADATLRALGTLERKAAADRATQSVRAGDPELARTIVLAGTGAASAAQVLAGLKAAR